jgi:hypothetical protein
LTYPISEINLDSARPTTVLTPRFCHDFLEADLGLQLDNSSGLYFIDNPTHQKLLTKNPTFRFNVTTSRYDFDNGAYAPFVNFDFSYQEMVLNATSSLVAFSTYYLPIQCSSNADEYVLGRAFMQKAYLIVTDDSYWLAQATIDPTAVPNPVALQQGESIIVASPKKSRLSKGAIAGIVIGCVFVAVLIVLGLLWVKRNRRRKGGVKEVNKAGIEKL